ncbi:MAG: hypothetical protein Crog4KO_07980 [Crocinitomicaceae bacterium]
MIQNIYNDLQALKSNNMKRSTQFLLFILMIAGGFTATAQNIIYVDLSATGANDGSSWTNAFTNLQSGLNATNSSDTVWVAAGTYVGNYSKTDGQDLVLYGGFDGTETAFSQRDWEANPTILDGNATDITLTLENLSAASEISGFTVQNGLGEGAGIYAKYSDANISDMIIQNNDGTASAGGGIFLDTSSYSVMDNLYFFGNQARTAGAFLVGPSASFTMSNAIFENNSTVAFAGGCFYFKTGANKCTFRDVVFTGNSAGSTGGAIACEQGSEIDLTNIVFEGNSAGTKGGAVSVINSPANFYHTTFYGNHAQNGGGALVTVSAADVFVHNSIFYGNTASGGSGITDFDNNNLTGDISVSYSLYEMAITTPMGTNSTSNNNPVGQSPYFLDETNPIGTDGVWMTADDGLSLTCYSPCIGVGLWNSESGDDITGYYRTTDPDIGAYELNQGISLFYVDKNASGNETGENWTDALTDFQEALDRTCEGDTIWVAEGNYFGTYTWPDDKELVVLGGFDGTETSEDQRDWEANVTRLDANYSGRVLYTSSLSNNAIFDGFTIRRGDLTADNGGGMYNLNSSLNVLNTIFEYNDAVDGAGMYNTGSSSISISNAYFRYNDATGSGAGIYSETEADITIDSTIFFNNISLGGGGAVFTSDSDLDLTKVIFHDNEALAGGAVYASGSFGNTFENCIFERNSATGGGAIYKATTDSLSSLVLNYCTFYDNSADNGGALVDEGKGSDFIYNSIFYGNSASISEADVYALTFTGTISVYNSLLQTTTTGWGGYLIYDPSNLTPGTDPLFIDESDPEGEDGDWYTHDDGLSLQCSSPCIAAGTYTASTNEDILGKTREINPDMGAYEKYESQGLFYVDLDATGSNNGTSWADAFTNFQDALNVSCDNDTIWVADGTYLGENIWPDDKDLVVLGGFTGTETQESQRDWETNATILEASDYGNVVYTSNLTYASVLDGFTIQNGDDPQYGGGMYNLASSLRLHNLILKDNESYEGGAMYNKNCDSILLNNVYFLDNDASSRGGGLYHENSNGDLTNVVFNGNTANNGGAMYNLSGTTTMYSCDINSNSCDENGGGLYWRWDSLIMDSCTMTNNSTNNNPGGAIYAWNNTNISMSNCLVDSNSAITGAGIHSNGAELEINKSIFRGNTANGGGAIYISGSSYNCNVYNSVFEQNSTVGDGGAISKNGTNANSKLGLFHSTFVSNSGDDGGAYRSNGNGIDTIINCIFYNNSANSADDIYSYYYTGTTYISHSLTQNNSSGWGGTVTWDASNLTPGTDPLFVDFADPIGADGEWGTNDDGLRLSCASPCVATGTAIAAIPDDIIGFQRDIIPDIGAYERNEDQGTWYVNVNASGNNNGSTWADAFTDFQDALEEACDNDTIWVAQGTYLGNYTWPDATDLVVLGGFTGSETTESQRDWENNITILEGSDTVSILYTSNLSGASTLNGFTIQNGDAPQDGGGMYNLASSIRLSNLIFANNEAENGGAIYNKNCDSLTYENVLFSNNEVSTRGGAIYNEASNGNMENVSFYGNSAYIGGALYNLSGTTTMEACLLDSNWSDLLGAAILTTSDSLFLNNCIIKNGNSGSSGGAIYGSNGAFLSIVNSIIESNTAVGGGGGIYGTQINLEIEKCVFANNSAASGGGMRLSESNCNVVNTVFDQNNVSNSGGALYLTYFLGSGNIGLYNTTFTSNSAPNGGGAIHSGANGNDTIVNCIFYNNSATDQDEADIATDFSSGDLYIAHSLTQNNSNDWGWGTVIWDASNLTPGTDPLFVDLTDPIGADGEWGTNDDGLRLTCASPCIATGTAIAGIPDDITGFQRDLVPDMGAYERSDNQGTWYVNVNATGNNDGTSWTDAYTDVQDAMTEACDNDTIWVAQGTYFGNYTWPDGKDLVILGGFDGSETTESQRDWNTNVTIMDGQSTNSVVSISNLSNVSKIDGFTVQNGVNEGAGFRITDASLIISNMIFDANNTGGYNGGGLYVGGASDVQVSASVFSNNVSANGGGIYGTTTSSGSIALDSCDFTNNSGTVGAALNSNGMDVTIFNSVFESNSATSAGGIAMSSGELSIEKSVFSNNYASFVGGAISVQLSTFNVSNTLFENNVTGTRGGAIISYNTTIDTLTNCTFYNNNSGNGGAIYFIEFDAEITNCLFSGNEATGSNPDIDFDSEIIFPSSGTANVSYSQLEYSPNVPSGGTVNYSNNVAYGIYPDFVDTSDVNGADDVWMTADDGLVIYGTSSASEMGIANATITEDITGVLRNDPPSIGAYETQCLYVAEPVAPTLTVLDTILYLDSTGVASLTADALVDKLTDNCGIQTITASQTDFDCNDQGTITVTVTATDFDGNSTSADALVTIVDTIVATVVCQSTNFYLDNSGYANVDPAQIAINSWDNCALSYSTPNGFFTCNDVGNQYVEVTVTELNGNAQTCGTLITIIDTIAPVASTQDIDVYLDANGEVSITPQDVDNASNDNCGWLYTTISPSYFTCSEVGANTITFELSDDSGNTVFAYPVVTVHDTTTPTILAQNVTVQLDGSGFAQISVQDVDLGTFDNCSIASSVLSTTTFNCNDVGANTVTYTVTDVNGNISTVDIVVTVEDPIAPSLNCTNTVKELNAAGLAFVSSSELVTSFDDNCSVSLSLSQTDFDCADVGANAVTVTATDLAGNTATCSATITIVDNLAPEPVATLDDIESTCEVSTLTNPFVTDNCSPVTITNDATLPITSSTTVIWTYADTSGNVSYQSQNVVITGVDASVTQVDDLNLEAVNINADAFQWVNCNNNFAAIPGEDLYVFTASQNGTYAVIVTQNGCQDTSACYTIDQVGLESLDEMSLVLAPNPANGGTVNVLTNAQVQSVTVMDATGKVVAVPFETSLNQLDVSGLSTGSYFVRVLLESGIITEKLIITRQ